MNCANKFEIADNCKLTCDNCDNPTASPTTCGDLKVSGVTFTYEKYTKTSAGTIKKKKTGKKCRHLAEENKITIRKNCADEIIRDYCKLTCDNCGDDSAAPSISVSAAPSISVSASPTSALGVAPATDPPTTSCVDLNEANFSYKKYNDTLIFKTEKTGMKCKSLAQENDITIKMNCANKFEIADNCKLTCDNCDNPTA